MTDFPVALTSTFQKNNNKSNRIICPALLGLRFSADFSSLLSLDKLWRVNKLATDRLWRQRKSFYVIAFASFRRATLIANRDALVPWGRDFQIQNYLIIILFASRHAKAQHVLQTLLFTLKVTLLFQQIANLTCILTFTTKVLRNEVL